MRSIVLVAACLACAGNARRMQTAEQITENGDMPGLKKLANLLLASNSFFQRGSGSQEKLLQRQGGAVAGKQEIDNTWALGDEKGRRFADPIAGTHSQAEVEFKQKQQKMVKNQAPQSYGHTWGLGDEKGRQWAGPKAGTHSQAEVEFKKKQQKWGKAASQDGVFAGRGGAFAKKQKKSSDIDNTWALGYEKGRTYDGPIAGTHSQAEVEFLQKQKIAKAQAPQKFGHTWGLGDEKGRQWANPKAGTRSQAEVEFKQKQSFKQDNWHQLGTNLY